jgi:hypothetical protein
MTGRAYAIAAEALLVLHAGVVVFIIGGFLAIWVGYWRGWRWVHGISWRVMHLVTIAIVAGQAVLGQICPLTIWENGLRIRAGQGEAYEGTFVSYWVRRLLFYEAEPWVFQTTYMLFLGLVVATLWLVPMRSRKSVSGAAALHEPL